MQPPNKEKVVVSAGYLLARAIRYTNGKRITALKCATCGRDWDVSNRGKETGFIVAAADSHAMKCKRLKLEAERVRDAANK